MGQFDNRGGTLWFTLRTFCYGLTRIIALNVPHPELWCFCFSLNIKTLSPLYWVVHSSGYCRIDSSHILSEKCYSRNCHGSPWRHNCWCQWRRDSSIVYIQNMLNGYRRDFDSSIYIKPYRVHTVFSATLMVNATKGPWWHVFRT